MCHPPTRSTPAAALLVLLTVAVSMSGCERRSRTGEPCASAGECAWGLECAGGYCHRPGDPAARGVEPAVVTLPRAEEAPRAKVTTPPDVLAVARQVPADVEIGLYTSRHLPETVRKADGTVCRPDDAARELARQVSALAARVPGITLGERAKIVHTEAARLGLPVLRGEEAVPVVVGATLEAGGARTVIPLVRHPDAVPYELAAALWRLARQAGDGLRVGLACVGEAFCPLSAPVPPPEGRAEWSEPVAEALRGVEAPFETIRARTLQALRDVGIEAVAVRRGEPLPDDLDAMALAAPQAPLAPEEIAWLRSIPGEGVGLVTLLPGARLKASSRRLVALETGEAGLLEPVGLRRDAALLVDRGALRPLRVPVPGRDAVRLPLTAEADELVSTHGAVGGLSEITLPLAGSFEVQPTGSATPLAFSRPTASPARLPCDASEAALDDHAPIRPAGSPRALAAAISPGVQGGREVILGSALGLVSMSAPKLVENLLSGERPPRELDLVRRLAPYAEAAEAYHDVFRENRTLREEALQILARATYWVATPVEIRRLAP
ncbi:MAG: hypothetical protein ACQEXJ_11465 [Myxococcota bacterium]